MNYIVKENVLNVELEGQTYLLEINSGEYFSLDTVSSDIWGMLVDGEMLETIESRISQDYNVPMEQVKGDLQIFIQSLVKNSLLEPNM